MEGGDSLETPRIRLLQFLALLINYQRVVKLASLHVPKEIERERERERLDNYETLQLLRATYHMKVIYV